MFVVGWMQLSLSARKRSQAWDGCELLPLAVGLMGKYGTNRVHILRLGVRLDLEEHGMYDIHGCGENVI